MVNKDLRAKMDLLAKGYYYYFSDCIYSILCIIRDQVDQEALKESQEILAHL